LIDFILLVDSMFKLAKKSYWHVPRAHTI